MVRKRRTGQFSGVRNNGPSHPRQSSNIIGAGAAAVNSGGAGTLSADNFGNCGWPPFMNGSVAGSMMNEAGVRQMFFDPVTTCFTSRRGCGPSHGCYPHRPQLHLTCGTGYDIDLENVPEGETSLLLASVKVNRRRLRRPLVKIDFSALVKVEDGNEVELVIALRRTCNGYSAILQTWELEFDTVECLPFSFTYCDDDVCPAGCCTYTVEIIGIVVENGETVNELETVSTAINAIVQG